MCKMLKIFLVLSGTVLMSFVIADENFRQKNPFWLNAIKKSTNYFEDKLGTPTNWQNQAEFISARKLYQLSNLHNSAIIRAPPTLPANIVGNMVMENIVESKPLRLIRNYSSNSLQQSVLQQEKANVIDWFLGVIGIRNPETNPPAIVPAKNCPTCKCGQTFQHVRIVGGIETMVNEYPWMAALLYSNRFYCGASLISNKYCLTAAHCVNGFNKDRISIVFLDHDRSSSLETKTISRKVKNIIRHRGYGTGGNYNNDIALLQLDQEITLTGKLRPVCLPPTGRSFTGFEGIVTGWGAIKEHGQTSNKLQEVRVPILSNIDCRKTGYRSRITDNMLCAGYPNGQKDSCQGDSGGPLHIVNGSMHQIVGIVSWGEGCAQANYPGVYTRVNRYISWIRSNTRDACYC